MKRHRLTWGALTMVEPTPDEVLEHAAALSVAYNDPKNAALLGHADEIDRDEVIEHYLDLVDEGGRPFMLFEGALLLGDGDLRGIVGGTAELAFLIASPAHQGKGLGTKFALALAAFGFRTLELATIYASVAPNNAASIRVFEKLGFVLDESPTARGYADENDDVVFSIPRAELEARHADALAQIAIAPR